MTDGLEDQAACLCFFLQIEDIDLLDLALLISMSGCLHGLPIGTHQPEEEDLFVCAQGDFGINVALWARECVLSGKRRGSTQMFDELQMSQ